MDSLVNTVPPSFPFFLIKVSSPSLFSGFAHGPPQLAFPKLQFLFPNKPTFAGKINRCCMTKADIFGVRSRTQRRWTPRHDDSQNQVRYQHQAPCAHRFRELLQVFSLLSLLSDSKLCSFCILSFLTLLRNWKGLVLSGSRLWLWWVLSCFLQCVVARAFFCGGVGGGGIKVTGIQEFILFLLESWLGLYQTSWVLRSY